MQISYEKLKDDGSKRKWMIRFNVAIDDDITLPAGVNDPPADHPDYELLERLEEKLGREDSDCFIRPTRNDKKQLVNIELYI